MNKDVDLFLHYRARHDESIEQRHTIMAAAMREVSAPLGWAGAEIPDAPDCGEDLGGGFQVKVTTPSVDTYGSYVYRGETYQYRDESTYDDKLSISFESSNKSINYQAILHLDLPSIVVAFKAYLAKTFYSDYFLRYEDLHEDQINILRDQNDVDINGRNNIFTLHPAQYWDAELCRKALGYGPDEVIRRLDGHVPLVRPLMDGVYTVFNDNTDLTFEEFCAFNDRFKPVLGLA
jgi:hypothetical protein